MPERVSGAPPPLMLPGAALGSLAARFCWHQALERYPSAFRGPPLDAARRSTWEPRGSLGSTSGSGRYPSAFRGPHTRCCQAQHLGASRLVSAGRGSTSGSGRYPSAFRGPFLDAVSAGRGSTSGSGRYPSAFRGPLVDAARRTWEPGGSLVLAGVALQARARFGALPLDAARRSTWEPRGSFLLAGAALEALERVSGPPRLMLPGAALGGAPSRALEALGRCPSALPGAALGSLRLWTVPERVSGPPP